MATGAHRGKRGMGSFAARDKYPAPLLNFELSSLVINPGQTCIWDR